MTVILEETEKFLIESYGNGFAYTLCHKPSGASGHLQGEDAGEWRRLYDYIAEAHSDPKSMFHGKTWDWCLSYVCEDHLTNEEVV